MKLWKKLSAMTMAALLVSTAASGTAVVSHSFLYNREKTVENYEQQLNAVAYAMREELNYEPLREFGETTENAYYNYIMKKFDASSYMLLKDDEVVCNLTPFLLKDPSSDRWKTASAEGVIQKMGSQYVLIACMSVPMMGTRNYKLVLVRDISALYEDIRGQACFYAAIYFVMAFTAALLVSVMTKKALAPLRELRRAALDISGGMLDRRADVSAHDETGEVAEAFNSMAERIEKQVEELSAESERRRQMLGSLTHEMKTPMTSIMGYADSLLHVNLTQEQKERALRHIYDECGRLGRLNSKLMSLIGMYDNDSILLEETSIEEIFEIVSALEEKNLNAKKMTLKSVCRMNRRMLDRDLFISLLVNLVDNAARASGEGDCIRMTALKNIIAVQDNGCGIPEEEIPRVTEAFYRVDKARSQKAGGNGLGLALCSMIARLHDAELRIESRPGEGTKVSVVFPE